MRNSPKEFSGTRIPEKSPKLGTNSDELAMQQKILVEII